MQRKLAWREHIVINIPWFGLNITTGTLTPLLLPYLVLLLVSENQKNTSLAAIRVTGLAVAMLVQPMAGILSDRSPHPWGRRRPFILLGTILTLLFLLIVAATPIITTPDLDSIIQSQFGVPAAFVLLLVGIVLVQGSLNIVFGALIGLIPDLVPEKQRGRSSGLKAVFELLPAFFAIPIGIFIDRGRIGLVIGIVMSVLFITMLINVRFVEEKQSTEATSGNVYRTFLRIVALTSIFVFVTQFAIWLIRAGGAFIQAQGASFNQQIFLIGIAGIFTMAGAIFLGVYFGAGVGIGKEARQQMPFIWWVINRLLFLAAVGSIQGFALFYLRDYLQMSDPATKTSVLFAVVGVFLIPSALAGGYLADYRVAGGGRVGALRAGLARTIVALRLHRLGRKGLVALAGIICTLGTLLLLMASDFPMVILSGSILGIGTGLFMATNWALGTSLVPASEAGRYLGISNLAGAGAGIIGVGIGGPIADFFNRLEPGLGYMVIFSIYAVLFLLSVLASHKIEIAESIEILN